MEQYIELTKRNIRLYFRDKGAVFFSLLSMLIVIVLMILFLSDMNINTVTGLLENLPGHDTSDDEKNAGILVLAWTSSGLIPVNAVMVALSSLSSIIRDKTAGRINSIYTSPVSRITITLSYISAACISSVIICILTAAFTEGYLVFKGMEPYTVMEHLKILGMIIVNSFAYSAIMYTCAALVNSEGAWSGVGTILGTLTGFLGGIYLLVGTLSDGLQKAIGCTPMIYGTVMFRRVMLGGILSRTFADAPEEMISIYREKMSIDYTVFGKEAGVTVCVLAVLGFGILFMAAGAVITNYSKKRDR